jgi:hypothetical protein
MKRLIVSIVFLLTLIAAVVGNAQNIRVPSIVRTLKPQPTPAPTLS